MQIRDCAGDSPGLPRPPSIFMTISPLRRLKHEDFVPQVVTIGPYHYGVGPHYSSLPENQETERYKAVESNEMNRHKKVAFAYVEKDIRRYYSDNRLLQSVRSIISDIRQEYATDLDFFDTEDELVKVFAEDAAFVVEILRCNGGLQRSFNRYYCSRFPRPLRKSVLQDFFLLENQIPLFLLLKVIALDSACASDKDAEKELGFLIHKVACELLPFCSLSRESVRDVIGNLSKRRHLLDCLYRLVTHGGAPPLSSSNEAVTLVEKPTHFPRAVELYSSGITFRGVDPGNMVSVKYDPQKAILYVPKIRVGDDTERLFRNLLAYESHLIDEVHVLSYFRFMNSLVDGPDDVALLVEKGVLAQDIGSNEEVAAMWNMLCINTMRVCSEEYEEIAQMLMRHCGYRFNALKAEFKRTYLSRPWLLISVMSAASLLIMTLIITIYTVFIYEKPGA
ncbi:hypothetical protein KP509_23G006100 [Ceratopteris richardii]|nr:hypothetical protein KP509_23G006100 [Ceratopteris richardii]